MNHCADITTGEVPMMQVERASRALGARVQGIDLGGPLDEETFSSVRDALNRHSVLVFPEQVVEPPAQIEFSGRFGRLKHHVLKENLLPGLPEIYVLTNMTSQNEVTPRPYAGAYWHTDLSYETEPAFGSVMYAVEVPEVGGDTMRINELPPAEGEAILAFLYEHCTSERFVYRHRWSRHDVVMWDNRATMHKAVPDYDDRDHRYMRRTTIAGSAPRG